MRAVPVVVKLDLTKSRMIGGQDDFFFLLPRLAHHFKDKLVTIHINPDEMTQVCV